MAETTQIHPDKVRAYLATDYRLGHTAQDIVLTIGKRSDRLAALFATKGVNCGAFLTAYNPRGALQPEAANQLAHAQLATQLEQLGRHPCLADRTWHLGPSGDFALWGGSVAAKC